VTVGSSGDTFDGSLDGGVDDWDDDHATVQAGRASAVLTYLAERLVDDPEAVSVDAAESRQGVKLSLRVAPDDMGKVIGRRGRVAQSIRSLVRAAGASDGIDVHVDIVD
jgi:uncharacterized protein